MSFQFRNHVKPKFIRLLRYFIFPFPKCASLGSEAIVTRVAVCSAVPPNAELTTGPVHDVGPGALRYYKSMSVV